MPKKITIMSFFFFITFLFSQDKKEDDIGNKKWYINVSAFAINFVAMDEFPGGYFKPKYISETFGKIVVNRNISPSFAADFQLAHGNIQNKRLDIERQPFTSLMLSIKYKFANDYIIKTTSFFDPYINLGIGYQFYDYKGIEFNHYVDALGEVLDNGKQAKNSNLIVGIVGGTNLWITPQKNIALNIELQYMMVPSMGANYLNYFQYSMGIAYRWGHKKQKQIKHPKRTLDVDNDGLVDAIDKCPNENGPHDNNGCPYPDTDKDGIIDKLDNCISIGGIESSVKDCNGCPDSDKDSMCDKFDKCPNEFGIVENDYCAKPPSQRTANQLQEILKDIKFNKTVINSTEIEKLKAAAELINSNGGKYYIISHTNSTGTEASNLKLSITRAKNIINELIKLGVPNADLIAKGYGEGFPICTNNTPECEIENARIEVISYEDKEKLP